MDLDKDGIGDVCDSSIDTIIVVTPTDTTTINDWVLYLDFDGDNVNSAYWNGGIPFYAGESGLSDIQISNVLDIVKDDFTNFPIGITTDSTIYASTNKYKRQHIIITTTSSWYGAVGGVSYIGSITWGDNTPNFVFSGLLGYNTRWIGDACSHEIGHSIGLNHQALYDASCTLMTTYNYGNSVYSPIMGVSYYSQYGIWWIGPTPYGCNTLQNDTLIIRNLVGY